MSIFNYLQWFRAECHAFPSRFQSKLHSNSGFSEIWKITVLMMVDQFSFQRMIFLPIDTSSMNLLPLPPLSNLLFLSLIIQLNLWSQNILFFLENYVFSWLRINLFFLKGIASLFFKCQAQNREKSLPKSKPWFRLTWLDFFSEYFNLFQFFVSFFFSFYFIMDNNCYWQLLLSVL